METVNKEAREAVYWMLSGSALTCGIGSVLAPDEAGDALSYASLILLACFLTLLFMGWFR